jgi:hypothetical protein
VQRDWLHLQHEHILGKGQAKYKRQWQLHIHQW